MTTIRMSELAAAVEDHFRELDEVPPGRFEDYEPHRTDWPEQADDDE